jgi:acyl-CoA-binding protein
MENEKLQLWALYMQATQGDAKQGQLKDEDNGQPYANQTSEELNKYLAWKKYEGKPQEEAKDDYVRIVKELLERHGQKVDF